MWNGQGFANGNGIAARSGTGTGTGARARNSADDAVYLLSPNQHRLNPRNNANLNYRPERDTVEFDRNRNNGHEVPFAGWTYQNQNFVYVNPAFEGDDRVNQNNTNTPKAQRSGHNDGPRNDFNNNNVPHAIQDQRTERLDGLGNEYGSVFNDQDLENRPREVDLTVARPSLASISTQTCPNNTTSGHHLSRQNPNPAPFQSFQMNGDNRNPPTPDGNIARPRRPGSPRRIGSSSGSQSLSSVLDFEDQVVMEEVHFHIGSFNRSTNCSGLPDSCKDDPELKKPLENITVAVTASGSGSGSGNGFYNQNYPTSSVQTYVTHRRIEPGSFLSPNPSTPLTQDVAELAIAPLFNFQSSALEQSNLKIYNFPFHLIDVLIKSALSTQEAELKMRAIKSFSFEFLTYGPLRHYDVTQLKKCAALSPALESIKIYRTKFNDYQDNPSNEPTKYDKEQQLIRQEWNETLTKILETSSKTLQHLEIQPQHNPVGLNFPKSFSSLETLCLDGETDFCVKNKNAFDALFLPSSIILKVMAPYLKKIQLRFSYSHSYSPLFSNSNLNDIGRIFGREGDGDLINLNLDRGRDPDLDLDGIFWSLRTKKGDGNMLTLEQIECPQLLMGDRDRRVRDESILHSVCSLEVGPLLSRKMVQNFHFLLPHVTVLDLKVWSPKEFGEISPMLFEEWGQLRELTIRMDGIHRGSRIPRKGAESHSFPVFDSILTGIPEDALQELRMGPKKCRYGVESWRTSAPLCKLTRLKTLRMSFNLVYNRPSARLLFTKISQMYSFAYLPGLEVTIGYKDCLGLVKPGEPIYCLEEIRGYVHLEREPAWMNLN